MTNDLQSKLVEILTAIQTSVSKASDFALSQLPDIARQYVLYGRAYNTLLFGAAIAVFVICVFVFLKFGVYGKSVDKYGEWTEARHAITIFSCMIGTVGFAVSLMSARDMLLVWLAPKVWLLQEIARLVKG
ncbi:MAG: hypothetical protein LBH10_05175 [Burkholderiaceae bacterium]|nr:hypothetical protein [Burkholderiaceae bacterium]